MAFVSKKTTPNGDVPDYMNDLDERTKTEFGSLLTSLNALSGGALRDRGLYTGSANQITVNGIFYFTSSQTPTVLPEGVTNGFLWNFYNAENRSMQLVFKHDGTEAWLRIRWGATFSTWRKFLG